MHSKAKIIALTIGLLGLGVSIALNCLLTYKLKHIPRESYIDTTYYSYPVPRDSVVIKYVEAYLPVKPVTPKPPIVRDTVFQTIIQHDSVLVEVPITQKHYQEKEYEAWVSGFMPRLDSCRVFNAIVPEKTPLIEVSVGIQAGIGYIPSGNIQPYIGLGIQAGIPLRKFKKK